MAWAALQRGACVWCLALAGCSSSSGSAAPGAIDSGTQTDSSDSLDSSAANYSNSACGKCVAQACNTAIMACESDPDCSAYLACLDGCAVGADGDVEPTCAAACPKGTSSSGTAAEMQLTTCRTSGAGAACSACGIDSGSAGNPIVHQKCTPMNDVSQCAICEDDHCCQTYAACHADPDCHAMQRCLVDCYSGVSDDAGSPQGGAPDGGSCDLICAAAHPKGLVEWAPRDTCISVFCTVACENPPMPPLDPCLACIYSKCADEFADLNGTPDGYLFAACITVCPSGANPCTAACMSKYPTTMGPENALISCQQASCPMCM